MKARPKILIVDDRPENLMALRVVLKDMDVELVEAQSGNEALKATIRHDFVLALLDIQMPEMDGYELAEILREEEKTAQLPFIFISAVYTDNLNVFKGYEKGAFSFITKPFQPEILLNKVKFFIDKYQQDIALLELNKDLKNINNELEAFSYSVSHDLRAPLRAVNGYAEMLKEDYEAVLDDDGKRIIQSINYYATRMGKLIDGLLSFSRLGRKELQKSGIDMKTMVETMVDEFRKTMPEKTEVKVGELRDVKADYTLLHQVMYNLISNAIKYSSKKENPLVEIYSEEKDGEVIFTIKDNGVGFDMQYSDKLFGVFQRLHSLEEFEGTGVGLAIVQRIIAKHKGRVWAEGKVGEGATFNFTVEKV